MAQSRAHPFMPNSAAAGKAALLDELGLTGTEPLFAQIPAAHRLREHRWGAGFLGGFTTVSGFAWDAAHAAGEGDVVRDLQIEAVDPRLGERVLRGDATSVS